MTVLASICLEEKLSEKGQIRVTGIALLDFVVPMSQVCCYYTCITSFDKIKLEDM
jgi:hypothetical protein